MGNQSPDWPESLWRRKLSPEERLALRTQPEREWEARLTEALAKLPPAPVPSNFTARVLAAIDLDERQAARSQGRHWNWRFWLPRAAVTAAILLFVALGYQHHEVRVQRTEWVKSLSRVTTETVPSVEVLKDFDTIQRISQASRADTELLAALQ